MPTPHLALTPLAAAQSQKHVTVNEALSRLDATVQLSALDRTHTEPPTDPQDGDRYLIAAPATGAWVTREAAIAAWDAAAQGWQFFTPKAGWRVWIEVEQLTLVHTGAEWTSLASSQLGINTSADETNRLAVASDAVLLTHDGAGVQAKLNKATEADTASLVLQTDYTGHAEIGLSGDNNLHVKTSPDGASFTDSIVIDAATAEARFPAGASVKGLSLGPAIVPNVLPDSGRFGGTGEANASRAAATFEMPGYLRDYNGSTLTPYARFIHNNSTYGGNQGALDPEVDALDSLLRPPDRRRYGVEWWTLKLTAGSGTAASETVNGVTRYMAMLGITTPMPGAFTAGYYVRVLSGSAFVDQSLTTRFARWGTDETGNDSAGVIVPADGWVFIERQMTFNEYGFNFFSYRLYAETAGDEILFAMPRLVFGHVELDPYLPGPLPNMRFYG